VALIEALLDAMSVDWKGISEDIGTTSVEHRTNASGWGGKLSHPRLRGRCRQPADRGAVIPLTIANMAIDVIKAVPR